MADNEYNPFDSAPEYARPISTPPPRADSPPPPHLPDRPPVEPTDEPGNPPPQRQTVVDPRVVALRGMFPDYDDLILQSVLESAGGNQDRAIDILLGMSDPDYKPEHPPQQPVQPAPVMTQEELDEQFARQLVLQEQQQQEQQWVNSHGPGVYQPRQGAGRRQQWTPAQQQQQPQQAQGDRPVGEFQEQFNKIAESGKKTFGSLFSKVKAKIQEFETGRPAGQASSSQEQWTPPPVQQQQQQQPQYWQPQPQQQPAYYDPNPNPNLSAPISPARTPMDTATSGTRSGAQGYDVSSSPPSTPPPSTRPAVQQLQPQPSPHPNAVPPPIASPPIDPGKLGLLPKRPVSLLRGDSSPSTSPPRGGSNLNSQPQPMHYHDDDDDGLEYAENPFEEAEGTKK